LILFNGGVHAGHSPRSWKKHKNRIKKKSPITLTPRESSSSFILPPSSFATMPTYIYETTDPKKPVRRFEVRQSMKDAPLTKDPETGEAIRRVISGGLGYMSKYNAPKHADMQRQMGGGGGSCGSGCGCH
jgi:predicted nucleic acid-binding Zn ribbon protein